MSYWVFHHENIIIIIIIVITIIVTSINIHSRKEIIISIIKIDSIVSAPYNKNSNNKINNTI